MSAFMKENERQARRAIVPAQETTNGGADALLQAWTATVSRKGDAPAIYDTSGKIARGFRQIAEEVKIFERRMLAKFPPGSVIAIQIGNHPSWPALLLACLRSELVVLPLERSISEREREVALKLCHAAAVIREGGRGFNGFFASRRKNLPNEWGNSRPSLLKLTSGTTAVPRAIRFRSGQLLADCRQICDTMGITDDDLNFAVIPLSHSYGFSNALTPLIVRGVPMVLSQDRMPRAILDDLVRTKATVFHGMPVFYQALSEMESPPPLLHLRLCISAGAPLPLRVAQKFRAKFGLTIHSFYGSSECGGICYDREAALVEEGFVGAALQSVRLNFLEPESGGGQVEVHSLAAGEGYFPEPEEEKLRAGRFVPDDLLFRETKGFRIVGRVSDVINVAGKKVHPGEVEAVLLAFAGVRQAVVFGRISTQRNEEIVACVVVELAVSETELMLFCRHYLSTWQVPRRILFVDEIPVTERGKVSRRELAEKFSS